MNVSANINNSVAQNGRVVTSLELSPSQPAQMRMKPITADSIPVLDGWGIDLSFIGIGEPIWTPLEWIDWFNLNVIAYGHEVAVNKFANEFDKSTTGATQVDYPINNQTFQDFVIKEGIDKKSSVIGDILSRYQFYGEVLQPVKNVISTVGNATEALANVGGSLKYILPLFVVGVSVIVLITLKRKAEKV